MADPLPETLTVISDRTEFMKAVSLISAGTGPVAIDAERASGFRYSGRAYLIQVFRRGAGIFLFDAPQISDFTALQQVLAGEEWVLHAASQDLACLREVGLNPTRLFDTELAARLLGLPRVGLATVTQDFLGISLAKEHSAADWSTRPLPQDWLRYAALDVALLVDLRDRLQAELDASGKSRRAGEEFVAVLRQKPKPPLAEPWRRLSGIHALKNARSIAVAKELWAARNALAVERDLAPGRLIPDSAIIAVAQTLPTGRSALSKVRGFTGRASRADLGHWWDAVERGLYTTELPELRPTAGDTLPPPRTWATKNPAAHARLQAAKTAVTERSEQLAIPVENLLTPDYLRRLAWNPPAEITEPAIGSALAELGARPWQVEDIAGPITDAFIAANSDLESQNHETMG